MTTTSPTPPGKPDHKETPTAHSKPLRPSRQELVETLARGICDGDSCDTWCEDRAREMLTSWETVVSARVWDQGATAIIGSVNPTMLRILLSSNPYRTQSELSAPTADEDRHLMRES